MTDEQAEKAYDEAEGVPLSEERIAEIVAFATRTDIGLPELSAEERAVMDALSDDFIARLLRGERPLGDRRKGRDIMNDVGDEVFWVQGRTINMTQKVRRSIGRGRIVSVGPLVAAVTDGGHVEFVALRRLHTTKEAAEADTRTERPDCCPYCGAAREATERGAVCAERCGWTGKDGS